MAIHECTPLFTEWVLHRVLGDLYYIECKVFCPTDLGMPSQRRRKYTLLRLKSAVVRHLMFGGENSDFERLTFRSVVLPGDIYCQASPKQWDSFCVETALAAGATTRNCASLDRARGLVSDARRRRWSAYERLHEDPKYLGKDRADISQNATTSFRVLSANVPTLCRNSDLVNLKLGRVFHPLEYTHALNIPIFGKEEDICVTRGIFERLSPVQVSHLAGNGMNLAQIGSIIMFALAGSELK